VAARCTHSADLSVQVRLPSLALGPISCHVRGLIERSRAGPEWATLPWGLEAGTDAPPVAQTELTLGGPPRRPQEGQCVVTRADH
jgi:hypothetical protein